MAGQKLPERIGNYVKNSEMYHYVPKGEMYQRVIILAQLVHGLFNFEAPD